MVPKSLLANFCIESIPVNKKNPAFSAKTQVIAQPLDVVDIIDIIDVVDEGCEII